ncbi:hypothetical protein P3T76_011039 [Phytophthora citrophthora]|uniref:Uncharacterized protein n=1 Tax=Phytophthora citrophthora TaxID=4793 RepID=A0AAD9LFA7_9STRA|nr:hypothetical protein P3T76_011039 [Phytophthora citrophthora]
MLKARNLVVLARALRRSSTAPAASAFLSASWSNIHPTIPHRNASFVPSDAEKKPKKLPSFAIAAAFEGHEDLEDDEDPGHLYGHEMEPKDTDDEQARALKEQFQRGMEKKTLWMQSLASQKFYAAVVKSVADCYAPLYAAMGLDGKCPLLAVARDEAKDENELETQYQPLRFDDMLTKATEQEAMALLTINQQSLLALTVVEHRIKLGEELEKRSKAGAGVVLPGSDVMDDENIVTLGSHLRMFYSWAMSAYFQCGPSYHPQMFEMYKRCGDAGLYVTANMNVQYLSALIKERRHDEVFEFYDTVVRESLPTSVFFYRNLLFAVSVTRKLELLDTIMEDMRVKGFKRRAGDYLNAIRAYDLEYFSIEENLTERRQWRLRNGKSEERQAVLTLPKDSYSMCLKRINEQEDHPERFEKLVEASQSVLALFDTMVDVDGLTPRHEKFFPRVITAAVYAQECERVPDLLALHAEHADEPLHYAGVRMGVNALLLLDKYTEAWNLIRDTNPHLDHSRFALVSNLFSYLCMKKRGADIISLLHDVEKLEVEGTVTRSVVRSLIPALCNSVDSVSDEELMQTVMHFDSIFRVFTNEHQFGVFIRECCHCKRLELVKTALNQWLDSSKNKRPLKGSLGLKVLQTFEGESDWAFMAEVFNSIDFSIVKDDDGRAIVSSVSRAYEALGQPERIKRAKHLLTLTDSRQKRLQQRKTAKESQQKKNEPRRSERVKATRNTPTESKPMMVGGIPIISSSS